jgi:hypothetical protein
MNHYVVQSYLSVAQADLVIAVRASRFRGAINGRLGR